MASGCAPSPRWPSPAEPDRPRPGRPAEPDRPSRASAEPDRMPPPSRCPLGGPTVACPVILAHCAGRPSPPVAWTIDSCPARGQESHGTRRLAHWAGTAGGMGGHRGWDGRRTQQDGRSGPGRAQQDRARSETRAAQRRRLHILHAAYILRLALIFYLLRSVRTTPRTARPSSTSSWASSPPPARPRPCATCATGPADGSRSSTST